MPWQDEVGLSALVEDMRRNPRPRPASVIFDPNAPPVQPVTPNIFQGQLRDRDSGYAETADPPLAGTDMPAPLRTPDAGRVAEVNAQSWDRLRDILGQGGRPPVPQIFNQGVEQHPLARVDDIPRRESQAWDLYNASTLGSPSEVAARRQEIIGRHNLNRSLENEYYNMGRGMFTIPRATQVSQTGLDPTQNLGTEGRRAGAQEVSAGAQQTQALTEAAKVEAALSTAQQRQRFMERFPNMPIAQLNELVAAEEARGGFAPRRLNFPIGGATVYPSGSPGLPNGTTPTTPNQPAARNTLITEEAASPPAFAAIADRTVPRPPPRQGSSPGSPDTSITPGEFVMRLARSSPGIFAAGPNGEANRAALRPYLESRFGAGRVAQAAEGTRTGLFGMTWSPSNERMAQGGAIGAAGQMAARIPGGGGLSSVLSRIAGTTTPARAVIDTSGTRAALARIAGQPMPSWAAPTVTRAPAAAPGISSRLGSGLGRFAGAPLAILNGALALPAAGQMGRSLFGGMTPEQEGNAILEAALNRNQW